MNFRHMYFVHHYVIYAATCSSIAVSGVGDLDGTYEEGPTAGDPFYRPGGSTFYEIYQFIGSSSAGWYIAVGGGAVYRVSGP